MSCLCRYFDESITTRSATLIADRLSHATQSDSAPRCRLSYEKFTRSCVYRICVVFILLTPCSLCGDHLLPRFIADLVNCNGSICSYTGAVSLGSQPPGGASLSFETSRPVFCSHCRVNRFKGYFHSSKKSWHPLRYGNPTNN